MCVCVWVWVCKCKVGSRVPVSQNRACSCVYVRDTTWNEGSKFTSISQSHTQLHHMEHLHRTHAQYLSSVFQCVLPGARETLEHRHTLADSNAREPATGIITSSLHHHYIIITSSLHGQLSTHTCTLLHLLRMASTGGMGSTSNSI